MENKINIYQQMPEKAFLQERAVEPGQQDYVKVNAHMHTPFSFSAFDSVEQALDMASQEQVKVVGINDFYAMDGYAEWALKSLERNLFPLFNIEFISLNKEDQENSVRVNDPNNPGRTYLSGKGLAFPSVLKDPWLSRLNEVRDESNHHVELMCVRLNDVLGSIIAPFSVSFEVVRNTLTRGIIRERHLAKALRLGVVEHFGNETEQLAFYKKVFGGKALKSDLTNEAAVENEIRGNLLKAGGAAFVPESSKAFLDMETVRRIILEAGGLPTYPFLADNAKGEFTDFEQDKVKAVNTLKARGIHSVEFITTRNTLEVLEDYAGYCWDNGMVVTFGSEHNTPAMEPLTLVASHGKDLSSKLMEINYKGACVVAAHQYLAGIGEQGYLDQDGNPQIAKRDEFVKLGHALIQQVTKTK